MITPSFQQEPSTQQVDTQDDYRRSLITILMILTLLNSNMIVFQTLLNPRKTIRVSDTYDSNQRIPDIDPKQCEPCCQAIHEPVNYEQTSQYEEW